MKANVKTYITVNDLLNIWMYRLINEAGKKEQERWKEHSEWHGANEQWILLENANHSAICWRQTKEQTRLKGTEDFEN